MATFIQYRKRCPHPTLKEGDVRRVAYINLVFFDTWKYEKIASRRLSCVRRYETFPLD